MSTPGSRAPSKLVPIARLIDKKKKRRQRSERSTALDFKVRKTSLDTILTSEGFVSSKEHLHPWLRAFIDANTEALMEELLKGRTQSCRLNLNEVITAIERFETSQPTFVVLPLTNRDVRHIKRFEYKTEAEAAAAKAKEEARAATLAKLAEQKKNNNNAAQVSEEEDDANEQNAAEEEEEAASSSNNASMPALAAVAVP